MPPLTHARVPRTRAHTFRTGDAALHCRARELFGKERLALIRIVLGDVEGILADLTSSCVCVTAYVSQISYLPIIHVHVRGYMLHVHVCGSDFMHANLFILDLWVTGTSCLMHSSPS